MSATLVDYALTDYMIDKFEQTTTKAFLEKIVQLLDR